CSPAAPARSRPPPSSWRGGWPPPTRSSCARGRGCRSAFDSKAQRTVASSRRSGARGVSSTTARWATS
ncbi:MAG: hypothetical protein AVDCRST_MAG11-1449, partial [uncultured Gemmatimonadaceae bacterium]